ncbi:MAG: hypothetical protein KIT70_00625 [Anaerolineales bacterium]|nr:MAG: hypothetical protein KIT70_00625 [Anaerolineales bacterium]
MSDFTGTLVVLLLLITALYILVNRDWRWAIAALGLQYVWAFLLVLTYWPVELAIVKLVTGWIAASVLGLTRVNLPQTAPASGNVPSGVAFRLLAAGLVVLLVLGAAPRLADWSRAFGIYPAWGGLLLIGIGLLQIALRAGFFRSALGLLTLFAGFEILYAAVEASTLVTGLLAAVNLGIALVGSYLLAAPTLETEE